MEALMHALCTTLVSARTFVELDTALAGEGLYLRDVGDPAPETGLVAKPLGTPPIAVCWCPRDRQLDPALPLLEAAVRRVREREADARDAALLRAAMPVIADGLMLVSTDGVVHHYSPSMEQLVGWTIEDVRAHGWTTLVYEDEEERASALEAIAALVMGQPSEGTRRKLTRKDGTRITAAMWSRVVADPLGGAPWLLGVMRDVSREDAEQIEVIRSEGRSRLGRLSRFVAHDFNNLLCAIVGHAELLEAVSDDARVQRSATAQIDTAENDLPR